MPTLASSLASPWLVVPLAGVTLVVVAAHVLALGAAGSSMPPSRRRIRTASGMVMMFTIPLLAYAFSIADVSEARHWTISWMLAAGMVTIVVFLAGLDMLNTGRLYLDERRKLREELRRSGRERAGVSLEPLADSRGTGPAAQGPPSSPS
jgi:hypothetical protein